MGHCSDPVCMCVCACMEGCGVGKVDRGRKDDDKYLLN